MRRWFENYARWHLSQFPSMLADDDRRWGAGSPQHLPRVRPRDPAPRAGQFMEYSFYILHLFKLVNCSNRNNVCAVKRCKNLQSTFRIYICFFPTSSSFMSHPLSLFLSLSLSLIIYISIYLPNYLPEKVNILATGCDVEKAT